MPCCAARPAIGNEPFAVLLADDLIDSQPGALQHMVAHHQATGASVLGWKPSPAKKPAITALSKCAKRPAVSGW